MFAAAGSSTKDFKGVISFVNYKTTQQTVSSHLLHPLTRRAFSKHPLRSTRLISTTMEHWSLPAWRMEALPCLMLPVANPSCRGKRTLGLYNVSGFQWMKRVSSRWELTECVTTGVLTIKTSCYSPTNMMACLTIVAKPPLPLDHNTTTLFSQASHPRVSFTM